MFFTGRPMLTSQWYLPSLTNVLLCSLLCSTGVPSLPLVTALTFTTISDDSYLTSIIRAPQMFLGSGLSSSVEAILGVMLAARSSTCWMGVGIFWLTTTLYLTSHAAGVLRW